MKRIFIILFLFTTIGAWSQSRPLPNNKTHFIFEVTLNTPDTITLPLIQEAGYDYAFSVDWGDGYKSRIDSFNDPDTSHIYKMAGVYDIGINGVCNGFSLAKYGNANTPYYAGILRFQPGISDDNNLYLYLTDIKNWGDVQFKWFDVAFCKNLKEVISPTQLDLSLMDSISSMFIACDTLEFVDLIGWDVSNIEAMMGTFQYCHNLKGIDISNWDVRKVKTVWRLFSQCYKLERGNIERWQPLVLTKSNLMFGGNAELIQSGVNNWLGYVPNLDSVAAMFGGCVKLTEWMSPTLFWDNENIWDPHNCFNGATSIQNYADVPSEWLTHPFSGNSDWFVRPSGGSYGTEVGTSYVNAWDGFSSIDWNLIEPNDIIYVCGTHTETLTIEASGLSLHQVYIMGNYTTEAGIIDAESTRDYCIVADGYDYVSIWDITLQDANVSCTSSVDCIRFVTTRVATIGCTL